MLCQNIVPAYTRHISVLKISAQAIRSACCFPDPVNGIRLVCKMYFPPFRGGGGGGVGFIHCSVHCEFHLNSQEPVQSFSFPFYQTPQKFKDLPWIAKRIRCICLFHNIGNKDAKSMLLFIQDFESIFISSVIT